MDDDYLQRIHKSLESVKALMVIGLVIFVAAVVAVAAGLVEVTINEPSF